MRAVHLQTEYLTEPVGIDIVKPRFYWNCTGGISQSAYQITVKKEEEVLWDSGKVQSSSMTHILYEGRPLKSRERLIWTVIVWDENGLPGEPSESFFEMGLLEPGDWKASWIAGDVALKKHKRYPADCFCKTFRLSKQVKRARLYITACGLYEAMLNGNRVGEFALAPGCTDYRKRLQYQTYDVTGLLAGDNRLEVQLADGWYRGSVGCFGPTNLFGRQTKLLCQLEVYYADGDSERICSDGSFHWSNDGPVRFADLKDGEIYDASCRPSYSGLAVVVREDKNLTASNNVIPKEKEHFKAKLILSPSGQKILDFGQNIAGFPAFRIRGRKGQQLRLLFGEILDEKGEFTQKNMQQYKPVKEFGKVQEIKLILGMAEKMYRKNPEKMQPTPKQEILFTCSGGEDFYKTRFAVFGFRYALIETDAKFQAEDFEAIAVYSDMERTGTFACSNDLVNRFFENTVWSMKGNFLDIPTDCPTRERLGWTGDAQVFFNTGAYIMNTAPFFRKWMRDMEDGELPDGVVPSVVPYAGFEMMYNTTGGSVGWADAAVFLPYRYWKRYGDRRILEQTYAMARDYAMFAIGNTGFADKKKTKEAPYNKYVYEKGRHLGEWLEPEEFQEKIGAGSQLKQIETATAYFSHTMKLMAEIAEELGRKEDQALFAEYAEGSRRAYQEMFFSEGAPDTDRQAKLVRPLALGLLEESQKKSAQKRLARAVENRQYRIGTGFLSTPFILPVLTEAGYAKLAYKMLENRQAPGWLYEVEQGATTVWEDWEGTVSHNHYSPSAVCQWLFDTAAGIRVEGENHFVLAPVPGGSLTWAKSSYHSIYGKVKSQWVKDGEQICCTFEIPANTTAEIVLPDGQHYEAAAGTCSYSYTIPKGNES